jgi:hypothetical protein
MRMCMCFSVNLERNSQNIYQNKKFVPKKNCSKQNEVYVRFEVFAAVTMKNAVFWAVAPCRSCVNRRFGGTSVYTISTQRHIPEDGILQNEVHIPNTIFLLSLTYRRSSCALLDVLPWYFLGRREKRQEKPRPE